MRKDWKRFGGSVIVTAALIAANPGTMTPYASMLSEQRGEWEKAVPDAGSLQTSEMKENGEDIVFSDGFEGASVVSSNAVMLKYWKDGIYPENWDSIGFGTGSYEGDLQLALTEDGVFEGKKAVHVSTQDAGTRISMNAVLENVDFTKEYKLRMRVKTQDVTGTGFYARSQVAGSDGKYKNLGDGYKLKGTNNWTLYEIPLRNLSGLAGRDSGKMTIEIFAEKMTGEIWVDQVELVESWSLKISDTGITLKEGETYPLTISGVPEGKDIAIRWTSSDEGVVLVDQNGLVTAVAPGTAEVAVMSDEDHRAVCTVVVNDSGVAEQFVNMRNRWSDRLTGHSLSESDPKAYQDILASNEDKAQEARALLIRDDASKLFSDLNLTMDLYHAGSNSTNSADSEAYATAIARIQNMAVVYASPLSQYYRNADLKEDILYALNWYYDHVWNEKLNNQAMFGNWYHWWISIPQGVANTVILMHEDMPQELLSKEAGVLKYFNEDPQWVYKVKGAAGRMEMTGANLAETSLASQLRGAACDDPIAVLNGTKYFDKFISVVTSGDGLYSDGSFIQHSNLAYTGGYGSTLLNTADKLLYVSAGTDWEVDSEKLDVLWNFIWDGVRPLYADGAVFDMVSGRGISRPSSADWKSGRVILEAVALLSDSAPDEWKHQLQSFVKAQAQAGIDAVGEEEYFAGRNAAAVSAVKNILRDDRIEAADNSGYAKVFGVMDKAVAHGDDFSLGISYASSRTGRFEFGNNENKQGWHQGDGAVYMYNGDSGQYADNYWNTVDNQRLAGITTDHSAWELAAWGNYPGNADYNGGAALGRYAAVAMDFKNYRDASNPDLTAKKAWFVFDDEIVHLGTEIKGIDPARTTETIVENKKVNGDNELLINGVPYPAEVNTDSTETAVSWAWLEGNQGSDRMGYYFPEASDVYVKREVREGSWSDVGTGSPDAVSRNYVSLAVRHDMENDTYQYVLLPGKDADEAGAYSEDPDIEILSNTPFVQAVHEKNEEVYSYVFWEPQNGEMVRAGDVESDYATVVMKKDGERITLAVSSPMQDRDTVKVRLYGQNLKPGAYDDSIAITEEEGSCLLTVDVKGARGAARNAEFICSENTVAEFKVYPDKDSVKAGEKLQLSVTALDGQGKEVTVAPEDMEVTYLTDSSTVDCSVDENGLLTVAEDSGEGVIRIGVKVIYRGRIYEDSCEIQVLSGESGTVTEWYTTAIKVTKQPDQTIYRIGEEFDPEGIRVVAQQSAVLDGTALESVISGHVNREVELELHELEFEYDAEDFRTPGMKRITIAYCGLDENREEKRFITELTVQVSEDSGTDAPVKPDKPGSGGSGTGGSRPGGAGSYSSGTDGTVTDRSGTDAPGMYGLNPDNPGTGGPDPSIPETYSPNAGIPETYSPGPDNPGADGSAPDREETCILNPDSLGTDYAGSDGSGTYSSNPDSQETYKTDPDKTVPDESDHESDPQHETASSADAQKTAGIGKMGLIVLMSVLVLSVGILIKWKKSRKQ